MGIYLLKSILCFTILLAFYKVALESLSIHKFKRFYLLAILPCAFIIPIITFTTYVEPTLDFGTYDPNSGMTPPYFPAEIITETQEQSSNYITIILWSIYALGVAVYSTKFCLNLYRITSKIKMHQKVKTRSFINVLIQRLSVPHTFFYYIFLDKEAFENQQIPKEVLLHEETHAKQLHSIDILLIEVFQILFWFNPLIYFYKKSIKLNHEFLADAAVLDQGISKPEYQNILLAFSSNATHQPLANAINYSLIKKRFTVMKTQSSKTSIWIRSTLLLPLLAILLFSFSSKKEIVKDIKTNNIAESSSDYTARSLSIDILKDGSYLIDDLTKVNKANFKEAINNMHQDINSDIRNNILNIHVASNFEVSHADVWFIYNSLLDYGFYRMVTDRQEIVKAKGNTPVKEESFYTTQKGATKAQIKEYNALASKYNNMNRNNMTIYSKDVARLKYLYNLMSEKQRQNAEPFPDFPEPPPAPDAPNVPQVVEVTNLPPPPPPVPANATPAQKAKYQKAIENYKKGNPGKVKKVKTKSGELIEVVEIPDVMDVPPPPPPPPPKSPLDHVIAMAKKNATFYFEGKQISSDEAIRILKSDNELNIATQKQNSNAPKVHISTQPITTNKKGELVTKPKTLKEVKTSLNEDDQGYVTINGSTYFYIIKNNKVKYFDRWGQRVDENGKAIKPVKIETVKQKKSKQTAQNLKVENKNQYHELYEKYKDTHPAYKHLRNTSENTLPKQNQSATFYYNDKLINQEKAKSLIDNNSNLNIQYIDENSKNPIVYITDRPLKIDNIKSIPKPNANTIVNHIKVMNRHKADFYLDNKKVSYKKALKYVKTHKDADVHSSLESGVVVIRTK